MKRLHSTTTEASVPAIKKRTIVAVTSCIVTFAACGGGGNNSKPAAAVADAGATVDAAAVSNGVVAPGDTPKPATATAPAATATPAAAAPGATPVAAAPAPGPAPGPAAAPGATLAPLQKFSFYRLGNPGNVGSASITGNTLSLEGREYAGTTLNAGNCSINSSGLTMCASVPTQNTFTLCGNNNGADKVRSRYVLFDPQAVKLTDVTLLKGLTFSGYENCGQDNVGTQSKGAPSATLAFDASANLTLTQYDRSPARVTNAPASLVNLSNDTVSNGTTARFNLYRSNGRYVIIATGVPTNGVTATDPGTLIAFVQN